MLFCLIILMLSKLPLIFKGATKLIGLTNVKVSILLDNALEYFSRGLQKNFYFLFKKIIQCGDRDEPGYPNPSGTGMGFNFSSPLDMGRVTDKYVRIGYGDRKCKTRPHPAPLPCLSKLVPRRIEREHNPRS